MPSGPANNAASSCGIVEGHLERYLGASAVRRPWNVKSSTLWIWDAVIHRTEDLDVRDPQDRGFQAKSGAEDRGLRGGSRGRRYGTTRVTGKQKGEGVTPSPERLLCNWWTRRGSNARPLECDSSALPAELRAHTSYCTTDTTTAQAASQLAVDTSG